MNFWDSSAFVEARNSASTFHMRAAGFLRQKTAHAASSLILPETVASITRILRPDKVASEAECERSVEALRGFSLVPIDSTIIESAMEIARRHGLKGADSIHLASALLTASRTGRRGFVFLTLDKALATVARAKGLRVAP